MSHTLPITQNSVRVVSARPLSVLELNTRIHLVLRQHSTAELIPLRSEKQTQVENLGKQCDLLFLEMGEKKEVIEIV